MPRRKTTPNPLQLELFQNQEIKMRSASAFERAKESELQFEREAIRAAGKNEEKTYVTGQYIKPNTIEDRKYQAKAVEIYEKDRNIIIMADTGVGGKTAMAARIINSHFEREGMRKKALFLTPEVVLSHQQETEQIGKWMTLSTITLTGEKSPQKRKELYKDVDIIFATAQTIKNDLDNGNLSLDDVGLVIFDEAHHGTGNYDYVKIGAGCVQNGIERVLMSASIAPNEERMAAIMASFDIHTIYAVDREDKEVIKHDHERIEETLYVQLTEPFYSLRNILKEHVDNTVRYFNKSGLASDDAAKRGYLSEMEIDEIKSEIRKITDRGEREVKYRYIYEYRILKLLWEYIECEGKTPFLEKIDELIAGGPGKRGLLHKIFDTNNHYLGKCGYETEFYLDEDQLNEQIKIIEHADDFKRLEPKRWMAFWRTHMANKALLRNKTVEERITILYDIVGFIGKSEYLYYNSTPFFFIFKDRETIVKIKELIQHPSEHPKLTRLIRETKQGKGEKQIVFVRFKKMARKIAEEIERETGRKVFLFMGQEKGNTRTKQKKTVEEFTACSDGVMVATSVGHEGFNLKCKDEFFYDFSADPRERIQRKGRVGRGENGFVIKIKTLLPDDKVSIDQIRDYISISRVRGMKKIAAVAQDMALFNKLSQELPFFDKPPLVDAAPTE